MNAEPFLEGRAKCGLARNPDAGGGLVYKTLGDGLTRALPDPA